MLGVGGDGPGPKPCVPWLSADFEKVTMQGEARDSATRVLTREGRCRWLPPPPYMPEASRRIPMTWPSSQATRNPRVSPTRWLLLGCTMGMLTAAIGHCQTPREIIELLRDRRLENGVQLVDTTNYPPELRLAARSRWEARLPRVADACWAFAEIAQSTFFAENPNTPTLDGPEITYASQDNSKRFEINTGTGEIRYVIDTEKEWRGGCNLSLPQDGVEPTLSKGQAWNWPHLLILQEIQDPKAADGRLRPRSYDELRFSFSAELAASEKGKPNQCPPGTWGETVIPDHCLFYVAFKVAPQDDAATVQAAEQLAKSIYCLYPVFYSYDGKNPISSGPWLGLDPAGDGVYFTPHHSRLELGRPAEVRIDVGALIQDSIDAVNQRLATDLSPQDYIISHVIIGWEIWGAYRSRIRLRDLSLRAYNSTRPAATAP